MRVIITRWSEILGLSGVQKGFLLCAFLCSFGIMADYGIVRPVSHSLFLSLYGSQSFPYVWLAIVPFNFLVVELYNRFLPRIGIRKMFFSILGGVIILNAVAALWLVDVPGLPFLFYIWKEIYVVLLFQQLWSLIHSTLRAEQAKFLYGLIFACGGVGGMCGNYFTDLFAVHLGSLNLLWFSIPVLLILGGGFYGVMTLSRIRDDFSGDASQVSSFTQAIGVIYRSKYLRLILAIVLLMQVMTTLMYYQFNSALEMNIPSQDLRTEYCGRVFSWANIASLSLQVVGSFFCIHVLGLRRSHLMFPMILFVNAMASLIMPSFGIITMSFITIKALDFSLFVILKEMLYLPLKREEKFQAKAIIDVFVHRSAKAVASCLILILYWLQAGDLITTISGLGILLLGLWIWCVYRMFRDARMDASSALT